MKKLFNLSCPQVDVNTEANADAIADDAELQLPKPTFLYYFSAV